MVDGEICSTSNAVVVPFRVGISEESTVREDIARRRRQDGLPC